MMVPHIPLNRYLSKEYILSLCSYVLELQVQDGENSTMRNLMSYSLIFTEQDLVK